MKIDLHCHTKCIKNGDEGREISAERFVSILKESNVKIAAITNHNSFCLEQYQEAVSLAGNSLIIWPGVELDVNSNIGKKKNHGHVIIVVSPDKAKLFDQKIKELCKGDLNKVAVDIKDLINLINQLEKCFVACHYKKTPSLNMEDVVYLEKHITSENAVVLEPSDIRRAGIILNGDQKSACWFGSDVKDWKNYSPDILPELIFNIESFDTFIRMINKHPDTVLLKSYLDKKEPINITIEPYNDLKLNLQIYKDFNVIFGEKATGKTDILHEIEKELTKAHLKVSSFYVEQKSEDFIKIVDHVPSNEEIDLLGSNFCESEIKDLSVDLANKITSLIEYKSYFEYARKRSQIEHLKISKARFNTNISSIEINNNKKQLDDELKSISTVLNIDSYNVLNKTEASNLENLLIKLRQELIKRFINQWIEFEALKLEKFSIDNIKNKLAIKQGVPVRPNGTGLLNVFNDYLRIMIDTEKIIKASQNQIELPKHILGKLPTKGIIQRATYIGVLDQRSSKNNKWTKRNYIYGKTQKDFKDFMGHVRRIRDNALTNTLSKAIPDFKRFVYEKNIHSLKDFVNYSNILLTDFSDDYKPSNGEQSILLVQHVLMDQECDAIILDEAESGMGADYVNDVLLPEMKRKTNEHKIIVIVTHDPNVVVRSSPYLSIFREEAGPGSYKTYIGNSFEEYMINVNDENDKISWSEACLKICEGGHAAFIERGLTYGEYNKY